MLDIPVPVVHDPAPQPVTGDTRNCLWRRSQLRLTTQQLPPHPQIAPAFAFWTIAAVLLACSTVATVNLFDEHPSLPVAIVNVTDLTVLVTLQLVLLAWRQRIRTLRWCLLVLLIQAALVYLPFIWEPHGWGTHCLLAASALLLLPDRVGWMVFACVVVSFTAIETTLARSLHRGLYEFVGVFGLGLAIFGLTRLADTVRELHETRAELAELAITRERLRISRDLHDLLSYSLSAISIKGEVARRLMDGAPEDAKRELDSVLILSRQALTEVRAMSSSYRHLSLSAEVSGAQAILGASGIDVQTHVVIPDEISGPVDTALATVLREATTNVLRHSDATSCTIRGFVAGGEYRFIVSNNGVRRSDRSQPKGTGHNNLSERLEAFNGQLHTRARNDWYLLTVSVPLAPAK
jgi:two-component system sensor histidine kinase DesK